MKSFAQFSEGGGYPFGLFSHVGEEVREIEPAFTDRNSASSVEWEIGFLRIRDPLDHSIPTPVCRAVVPLLGMSMGSTMQPDPAGLCISSSEMGVNDFGFISAVAKAERHCARVARGAVSVWKFLDNNEASKPLSDHGYSSRHGIGSFNVVFSGGFPATTGTHYDFNNFQRMDQDA